jgi:hypothetical protein
MKKGTKYTHVVWIYTPSLKKKKIKVYNPNW